MLDYTPIVKDQTGRIVKGQRAEHIYSYPDINKRLAKGREAPLRYCQLSPSTNNLDVDIFVREKNETNILSKM